jgi:hypothetical protein
MRLVAAINLSVHELTQASSCNQRKTARYTTALQHNGVWRSPGSRRISERRHEACLVVEAFERKII